MIKRDLYAVSLFRGIIVLYVNYDFYVASNIYQRPVTHKRTRKNIMTVEILYLPTKSAQVVLESFYGF